ncbi:MAG: gamma-glutamyl-gamma-aminobutyrate hydrolase family protein, partial [Candidatus Methanomethylophilaceae archaeon]|nr:gamma-glutamyl-gamma-aminobutyrate hydrolase family protein [Candidatus Methanomethylophilaceae archaeon]
MKIYVVDNGGQWTHREWRVLKYMDVDTKIIPNTTPFDELGDVDALVLSGGAPSVATEADAMGNNGEYLDKADFPILGICAGMQFLSEHFGGTLGPAENPEFSSVDLHITDHECLFRNIPDDITVWASHND